MALPTDHSSHRFTPVLARTQTTHTTINPGAYDCVKIIVIRAGGALFGSMVIELLDRRTWATRAELANAIFEWIEAFYNPRRRHSSLGYRSPIEHEDVHNDTALAA